MPMKLKAQLMDDVTVKRALARLSYEIIEKSRDLENVVLIGIKTRGDADCGCRLRRTLRRNTRCKGANLHTGYYILP
mgnify:CR=1 FL=1